AAISGLTDAQPIQPIHKIHPVLARGESPDWAAVSEQLTGDPIIGAYVQFHGDVDLQGQAAALAGLHGAVVRDFVFSVNALVVELPLSAVGDLASEDAVQWLEPALP